MRDVFDGEVPVTPVVGMSSTVGITRAIHDLWWTMWNLRLMRA